MLRALLGISIEAGSSKSPWIIRHDNIFLRVGVTVLIVVSACTTILGVHFQITRGVQYF